MSDHIDLSFDAIYRLYPRKMGKSQGKKRFEKQIKTDQDRFNLVLAIERFVIYHEKRGTDVEFIPYFSTFMSHWTDWLDDSTGTGAIGTKETQKAKEQSGHYRTQAEKILKGEI